MQEKDFESAINEFVGVRINAYEFDEDDAVTEAFREFYSHLERDVYKRQTGTSTTSNASRNGCG